VCAGKGIEATCSRIRNNTGTTTNMYVEKVLEVGNGDKAKKAIWKARL
jgi:hypothetical protein